MPKARSKSKSRIPVPWWLQQGDEECPHCGQPYIYELEFRCSDCDGPCCAHCKQIHREGHEVCPQCVESTRTEDRRHG